MRGRISTDSHAHEFRLLRNRIEAEVQSPAVVLITSATDRDGAHLTAYGLAESLSKTHQRTVLVMTSSSEAVEPGDAVAPSQPVLRRRASDRLEAGAAAHQGGLSVITISPERLTTISRSGVSNLVQSLRSEHDYIVIDGGDLPNNSFGLLLATSADATLVTFLVGREQLPADRAMLDALERSETKVLGVVMNDQAAIDSFTRREHLSSADDVPAPERSKRRFVPPFFQQSEKMALGRIGKP
jgi:Mrp family chromosome partitioning ATPase